jgi:hypothetical protein
MRDFKIKLAKAKQRDLHWSEVAAVLREWRDEAANATDNAAWIYEAAEITEYSQTQLRLMERMSDFLRELKNVGKIDDVAIYEKLPISHLHLIHRMFALKPEQALSKLKVIQKNPDRSYRDLLADFKSVRQSAAGGVRGASKRLADAFTSRVLDAIETELPALYEDDLPRDVGAFRATTLVTAVDGVIIAPQDGADGIMVRAYGTAAHMRFFREMTLEIVYSSSFFRWLWVVLPPARSGNAADELPSRLEALGGLSNVGVVTIAPDDDTIAVLRRPSGGPAYDRRSLNAPPSPPAHSAKTA